MAASLAKRNSINPDKAKGMNYEPLNKILRFKEGDMLFDWQTAVAILEYEYKGTGKAVLDQSRYEFAAHLLDIHRMWCRACPRFVPGSLPVRSDRDTADSGSAAIRPQNQHELGQQKGTTQATDGMYGLQSEAPISQQDDSVEDYDRKDNMIETDHMNVTCHVEGDGNRANSEKSPGEIGIVIKQEHIDEEEEQRADGWIESDSKRQLADVEMAMHSKPSTSTLPCDELNPEDTSQDLHDTGEEMIMPSNDEPSTSTLPFDEGSFVVSPQDDAGEEMIMPSNDEPSTSTLPFDEGSFVVSPQDDADLTVYLTMPDHHLPGQRYRRVSNEDRQRIIDAFQEGTNHLKLSDELGIKRQTARSIISTFLRTGRSEKLPRGGCRNSKMNDDMKNRLYDILNQNPQATLEQMRKDLEASFPDKSHVSTSTIGRTLEGMLFTTKISYEISGLENEQRVLDSRAEYAEWYMQKGIIGKPVFVDECGYNVWTRRTYGGQRRRHLSVTLAITPGFGLVHHTMVQGCVTREGFERFLADTARCCQEVFQENDEPVFLIFNNARPHFKDARLPEGMGNVTLKPLPPYSPFLNPVENAHSAFKAYVKRTLECPEWQRRVDDREAAQDEGISLQQVRLNLLLQVGRLSIGVINADACTQWCRRTQTFFPRCLARQNIELC